MKLDPSDQKIVNDFFREHVNRSYKNPMNSVRMNVDHTFEHRERIFQICNHLIDNLTSDEYCGSAVCPPTCTHCATFASGNGPPSWSTAVPWCCLAVMPTGILCVWNA